MELFQSAKPDRILFGALSVYRDPTAFAPDFAVFSRSLTEAPWLSVGAAYGASSVVVFLRMSTTSPVYDLKSGASI